MDIEIPGDNTPKNEGGSFDALDNEWETEDTVSDDDSQTPEGEGETKEGSDDKDKDTTPADDKKSKSTVDKSAIFQKRRYREKLQKAEQRINDLEKKLEGQVLTEEQQQEQQARKQLRDILREELSTLEEEKKSSKEQAEELLEEELEEVLSEDSTYSEEEILEVCEDLEVSPKQAVRILKRTKQPAKKTPPKVPQPKKASSKLEQKAESEENKPKTFDDVGNRIKDLLKKGKYE